MAGKRKQVSDGFSSRKLNADGEDNRTLITPEDLQLNPDSTKIKLKTPSGKTIHFKVKSSDTIGSIKVKIQAEEPIPFNQQELIFNGIALEDMDTVANLHIKEKKKKPTLRLLYKSMGFITIHVETDLRDISLRLKPSDTIGIIMDQARLCFPGVLVFNDVVVDESGTLADFQIVDGSKLVYVYKEMQKMEVFVKNTCTGKTITLEVEPWDTIDHLKFILVEETDIRLAEQVLIYNNMVLDDDGTLFDFGITEKLTLTLMLRPSEFEGSMQIFIKTLTRETIALDVKPFDTIEDIKAMIQDKVDIPSDEQELIFNKMVIDDVHMVADARINNGSTLTLMRISRGFMRVFIKNKWSAIITLDVRPSETIRNVISKYGKKGELTTLSSRLFFNGKQLEDSATLADYHITNESTICLDKCLTF